MADNDSWRGKVGGMTDEEVDEFLKGPHLCRLACLDEEGWPYIVPLWYQYRDGGYYVIPRARSVWAKHIQRDPRVHICVDIWETMQKVMAKGEGRDRRGAQYRRQMGRDRDRDVAALSRRERTEVSGAHAGRAPLAYLPEARFANDLAGRGLGRTLQAREVVAAVADGMHRPEPAAGL